MGHKSKKHKRGRYVPQINTPTLKELNEKLVRLGELMTKPTDPASAHRIASAYRKVSRRLAEEKANEVVEKVKEQKEKNKLTQEEKVQKKKDYERQRKDRYKTKEK